MKLFVARNFSDNKIIFFLVAEEKIWNWQERNQDAMKEKEPYINSDTLVAQRSRAPEQSYSGKLQ